VVGITLTILLFGEVVPKIYSTKNALFMARAMAHPINVLRKTPPISWLKWLLVNGTKIIQKRAKKHGFNISSDELEQAIALTKEEHTSEEEHKILEGIIRFGSTECRQIMCSRMDVVALKESLAFSEVLNAIREHGYSRIPVFRDTFDNVIGILYIKDLLPHLNQPEDFAWTALLRKPIFVPENKKIDDLLKDFQEMKMHMAIVVDEYGGSSGIITLDDILEEIVGDITDEFDEEDIVYTKIDQNTYLFEGRTSLVDFYKVLDIDGKEFETLKGESETLGGFIVENTGRILRNNEYMTVSDIRLVVDSSDKRRIKLVKAVIGEK
jgi:gliding motility-associated protein GldE